MFSLLLTSLRWSFSFFFFTTLTFLNLDRYILLYRIWIRTRASRKSFVIFGKWINWFPDLRLVFCKGSFNFWSVIIITCIWTIRWTRIRLFSFFRLWLYYWTFPIRNIFISRTFFSRFLLIIWITTRVIRTIWTRVVWKLHLSLFKLVHIWLLSLVPIVRWSSYTSSSFLMCRLFSTHKCLSLFLILLRFTIFLSFLTVLN